MTSPAEGGPIDADRSRLLRRPLIPNADGLACGSPIDIYIKGSPACRILQNQKLLTEGPQTT